MNPVIRFIIFQTLIFVPFISGLISRKHLRDPASSARALIRLNLIFITPPVVIWSIWGLKTDRDTLILPFAGLAMVIAGFVSGKAIAPILGLKEASGKTMKISASLANHGFTMGGFICYLVLGEEGVGMASVFLVYFMPYVFLVIFPYARGNKSPGKGSSFIKRFLLNPDNLPLYASIAGLTLNLSGIHRPAIYFPLDGLLMVSIGLYYFTLGTNFTAADLRVHPFEQICLALSKFIIIPIFACAFVRISGVQGHAATVIKIQSFMPAAIYSVIASILYDLDRARASGYFIINSLLFILLVLPFLLFLQPWRFI